METNNKKPSVIEKFKNLSRGKKILLALGLVSFISIVFIIVITSGGTKTPETTTPSPTPSTNVSETDTGPKRTNVTEAYLLNRFNSLDGVLGFSWVGNEIVYATKDGIFELLQNKQIIKDQITEIDFSKNGKAVYLNGTGVYFADAVLVYSKALNISDVKSKISDSGNYILYTEGGNLSIKNAADDSVKSVGVTQNRNTSFGWVGDTDYAYFYDRGGSNVDIYNTDLQKAQSFAINKDQEFIGINSRMDMIASKTKENLYIKNARTEETTVYTFKDKSEINIEWITEDEIFVTEKVLRGVYDLYDQSFWTVNTSNKFKKFLANSVSITNKVDIGIGVSMNKDKTGILMAENKGKVWIISLIPSQMALYAEKGLTFFRVEGVAREAD